MIPCGVMGYVFRRGDEQAVELAYSAASTRLVGAALVGAALIAFYAGGALMPVQSAWGATVGLASLALVFLGKRGGPARLVFDNEAGALLVRGGGRDGAMVPYAEIAGFGVREVVHHGAEHGSGSVRYAVEMVRRDGGIWRLNDFPSEQVAEDFVARLEAGVQLTRDTRTERQGRSRLFQVDDGGVDTVIRWPAHFPWATGVGILGVVVGVEMALWGWYPVLPSDARLPFWAGVVFFGLIGALILFSVLFSIGKKKEVRITADRLVLVDRTRLFGQEQTLSLDRVAAVRFEFEPHNQDSVFLFLDESEKTQLAEAGERSRKRPERSSTGERLAAAKELARCLWGAHRLHVGVLSLTEKLDLEHLLQVEIERRTGRQVL